MCGITGFIDRSAGQKADELEAVVSRMAGTMSHRGPDDKGAWVDVSAGVALGHRRLSIIDLSVEGHQPMASACGRYVIVFNGEIYNFKLLRGELERSGHKFRSHSDTEVMLAAISRYGLEEAVRKFNGMFAFAVWDRQERALSLARDRMGEKPLYYGWAGDIFLFASELKAIRAHPKFENNIDRDSLALYMRYNCIPAPYSIYKNIRKLPPASILKIDAAFMKDKKADVKYYWSVRDAVERGRADTFKGSAEEASGRLDNLLGDSVKLRMESDVPLGVFLSGGIDSSLVTALMQRQSPQPVKTFTIGFKEPGYNEAESAALVARRLGAEHTEFYVSPSEAMAVIPGLSDIYDEPFADSSQIPTFLVSKLTRTKVTVSLSGDGGDEVFAGYNRYVWVKSIWRKVGWMNHGSRKALAGVLTSVPPAGWEKLFDKLGNKLPGKMRQRTPGDKIHKLADMMAAPSRYGMYERLVSHWPDPQSVVPGSSEPATIITGAGAPVRGLGFTEEMMLKDSISYLPDDILVKVDRASMAASLESRAPFLDHRVVEFAWQLPLAMKARGGKGKCILRELLYKYVPRELVDRPKMGFALPLDAWLRGPLKEWAGALLDESRIKREGFFDHRPVRQKWEEHLSGKRNWQYLLWDVLMFQAWYDRWKNNA
ncbi:MAG: asparagine synthase (glutamine-hydrolyzing) [Candidatus Omnitrophica bacterium]|nr:asparagine synthase (glutamine-hydrolyzing) [Candidatus Omnitrophota bacterium]